MTDTTFNTSPTQTTMLAVPGQPQTATRTFPGLAERCSKVRRFVRDVLAEVPEVRDDAEVVVAECFANAVSYTASGDPGGRVRIGVAVVGDRVRLEITDEGLSDTIPEIVERAGEDESPHGRGLVLVEALCQEWGRLDPAGDAGACPLDCPGALAFDHDCDRPYIGPVTTWAEFTRPETAQPAARLQEH